MVQLPEPDPMILRYVDASEKVPASEVAKARPTYIADLPDGSADLQAALDDLEARVTALENAANG